MTKSGTIHGGVLLPEIDSSPPQTNLAPRDVEGLISELHDYHALFGPLFQRAEQRRWALKYMEGLLLDIERKSIEPLARAVEGGEVRDMQHFIGAGAWDDARILQLHRRLVQETLGSADAVLIVDDSGFPKQGKDSVGVARQYLGVTGQVDNCQVGVFVGYASSRGHTLVDRRLYVPRQWFTPDYARRRQRCGVPDGLKFQTKHQLAWEMISELLDEQQLRFGWVLCDEGYGDTPEFLDRLDSKGLRYLAEVPVTTRVWLERPGTHVPSRRGKPGRPPTRECLVPESPAPKRADAVAQELPAESWQRVLIKEGAKGPMIAEFASLRVVVVRNGLPGPEAWLIFRRNIPESGNKPELKCYLSNAAASTPLSEFARVSGMRWPIETTFRESKNELGLDHYETRSWKGWHHHVTLTMLAHHFLVRLRLRLGDKAPALTVPQVRVLLSSVLPKREFDARAAIEMVGQIQLRNHAAYLSHRKRTIQRLDTS